MQTVSPAGWGSFEKLIDCSIENTRSFKNIPSRLYNGGQLAQVASRLEVTQAPE